jgi:hypothetical protein
MRKRRCGPAGDWSKQVRSRSKRPATPCRHDPRNQGLEPRSRDPCRCHSSIVHPLRITHPQRQFTRVVTETIRSRGFGFSRTLKDTQAGSNPPAYLTMSSVDRATHLSNIMQHLAACLKLEGSPETHHLTLNTAAAVRPSPRATL